MSTEGDLGRSTSSQRNAGGGFLVGVDSILGLQRPHPWGAAAAWDAKYPDGFWRPVTAILLQTMMAIQIRRESPPGRPIANPGLQYSGATAAEPIPGASKCPRDRSGWTF